MKTIKFSAKTKNGTIVIPKKYQKMIVNPVEVTLHYNGEAKNIKTRAIKKTIDIDKFFSSFQIDLSGFKFNRDEANER